MYVLCEIRSNGAYLGTYISAKEIDEVDHKPRTVSSRYLVPSVVTKETRGNVVISESSKVRRV